MTMSSNDINTAQHSQLAKASTTSGVMHDAPTPTQQPSLSDLSSLNVSAITSQSSTKSYTDLDHLPTVKDPDKAFADMTKQEYLDYLNNYSEFEKELIDKAQNDTSMVDQAYEDSEMAIELNKGIASRNLDRYGGQLTNAQQSEQTRAFDRAQSLGTNQSVNDSRLAQKEANQTLLSDLINIGQGVNRASQDQMQSAAATHSQMKQANQANKEAHKQSTISTIGSLGAMAIMAFAI